MCPFPRTIPASCRGDQLWMVEKYRDRKRKSHSYRILAPKTEQLELKIGGYGSRELG